MNSLKIAEFTFHVNKIFDECESFKEYQEKNSALMTEVFLMENLSKAFEILDLQNKNINLH